MKRKLRNEIAWTLLTQIPIIGKARVVWVLDTSGSMSYKDKKLMKDLRLLLKLSARLLYARQHEVYALGWDSAPTSSLSRIRRWFGHFEIWNQFQGGGTDFKDLFSHPIRTILGAQLYVIITDIYDPYPEYTGVPVVWLFTEKDGYTHWFKSIKDPRDAAFYIGEEVKP